MVPTPQENHSWWVGAAAPGVSAIFHNVPGKARNTVPGGIGALWDPWVCKFFKKSFSKKSHFSIVGLRLA